MEKLYNKALDLFEKQKLDKAKEICQKILKENSKDLNTLLLIGVIAFKKKKYLKSIEIFDYAIQFYPKIVDLYLNKTLALISAEKYSDALDCCEKVITLDKNNYKNFNLKGLIFLKQNKIKDALDNFKKSIKIDSNNSETYNNLGLAYKKIKKYKESIDCFKKSINLNSNNPEAYVNLGSSLRDIREHDEAIINYNKAIELNPNSHEAYNNRGLTFKDLNNIDKAISDYKDSLKIKPSTDAFNNIGNIYKNQNKLEKALENYEKILTLDRDHVGALGNVIHTKNKLCIWNNYEKSLIEIEKKIKDKKKVTTTLPLLSFFDSNNIIKQNAILESESYEKSNKKKYKTSINKKIKIGYYSADFRNHPVSFQLKKLIELHDKEKFETFAFSFFNKEDDMKKKLNKLFNHFIDVEKVSDENIANLSKKYQIDIAIDLMGFTQRNRFNIFNIGCAPIQINYLGYAGTLGSNSIDYIIADNFVIPESKQKYFVEKIIYLPHTFMINDDSKKISKKEISKKECNIPENKIIFANFNKFYKITPKVFNSWIQILLKLPDSILWLYNDNNTGRKNLLSEAKKLGLNDNRIFFANKLPDYSDYIARLKNVDLYLDTYPYSSHVVACDVVSADVPILTISGETFSSNVCASILNDLKLNDLIVRNFDEYINKTIEISKNIKFYKDLLIKNKKNSVLFNTKLYVKNFEKSLEFAHNNLLENKKENIYIKN